MNGAPVTILTNRRGLLTKRFYKDATGAVIKENDATLYDGNFTVRHVDNLGALAALLDDLNSSQAVTYGRPTSDAGQIVTDAKDGIKPGAIARTKANFTWAAGAGILMLDYDPPKDGARPLSPQELVAALRGACPFFKNIGLLWRQSASSGVASAGIRGQRVYVMVDDATQIPRIGKIIFDRLWLAGHGYVAISAAGKLLVRAPVDAHVWRAEGLDYAASPVLADGIERTSYPAKIFPGDTLKAGDVSDLTNAERDEVCKLQVKANSDKELEAESMRQEHIARMQRKSRAHGRDLSDADHVRAVTLQSLPDSWPLEAQSGEALTVGEMLDDRARWNEKRFADPIEGLDCGDGRVAVAYLLNGSKSCIYSHLHGGIRYTFQRDADETAESFDKLPITPRNVPLAGPMQRAACAAADVRNGTDTTRPLTELGNAQRLFDAHGEHLRFVVGAGKWLMWYGGSWQWDDGTGIRALATELPAVIFEEGRQYLADGERFAAHARASMTAKLIANAASLLADFQKVRVPLSFIDARPLLAGFDQARQVIDLASGTQRAATHSDYVTKSLGPAAVGDAAQALRWRLFLEQVFNGDSELIDWMQRFCGYLLTGETREHVFLFCYGHGANGKSVFLDILRHVLGDYGRAIASSTLCEAKRQAGGASPDLAALIGARLAVCGETEDGQAFAEALVKSLVAGETLQVRQLYAESVEFKPAFKLVIAGNHKPHVRGQDLGMWRRVRLVPFTQTFAGDQRDPHLIDKLKAEATHILAWMLEGCAAWRRWGLTDIPSAIRAATDAYQGEQDITGAWLAERTAKDPTAVTPMAQLYDDYRAWAINGGLKPMSKITLGRRIDERGFGSERFGKGSVRVRVGIRLIGTAADDFGI